MTKKDRWCYSSTYSHRGSVELCVYGCHQYLLPSPPTPGPVYARTNGYSGTMTQTLSIVYKQVELKCGHFFKFPYHFYFSHITFPISLLLFPYHFYFSHITFTFPISLLLFPYHFYLSHITFTFPISLLLSPFTYIFHTFLTFLILLHFSPTLPHPLQHI